MRKIYLALVLSTVIAVAGCASTYAGTDAAYIRPLPRSPIVFKEGGAYVHMLAWMRLERSALCLRIPTCQGFTPMALAPGRQELRFSIHFEDDPRTVSFAPLFNMEADLKPGMTYSWRVAASELEMNVALIEEGTGRVGGQVVTKDVAKYVLPMFPLIIPILK